MKYQLITYWLQSPSREGAPPTMRVVATFEIPHPSSGVNKRPLISVRTALASPMNFE